MGSAALDQGNIGKPALAKPVAETGNELETRRSAAVEATHFVQKPFTSADLIGAVLAALDKS